MARIAVAGFLHETNTFVEGSTSLNDFIQADAWPGLTTGPELLNAFAGANIAMGGFIEQATQQGHDLVPLVWASANPSGRVEQQAFDAIVSMLIEQLQKAFNSAQGVDALFLDLHGAMVTEQNDDGEGELLVRIRRVIGDTIPVVIALDFHANVSGQMVELSDACMVYRTYPHVDIADTGRRAAVALEYLLTHGKLYKAYRKLPFLIPMVWQCTLAEPFKQLMEYVKTLEGARNISAAIVPGFPLADCYDGGPTLLAYGADALAVEGAVEAMQGAFEAVLPQVGGTIYSCKEAVAKAMAYSAPVILADTQDNPGGGGSGDTTDLLKELMRQEANDVCFGVLCDPAACNAAYAAGEGAEVVLALGGHSGVGAAPLVKSYKVEALGDGRFTGTGPFYQGCRMDLGLMARLSYRGIQIIVSSRKQQAADQSMFRHVQCEPADYRIIVLKSSVHFRADFGQLQREAFIVAAPGVNTAQIKELAYKKLRSGITLM